MIPFRRDLAPIMVATGEQIEVTDSGPDDDFLKEHFDEDVRVVRRAFVFGSTDGNSQQLNDLFFGQDSET